MSATPVDFRSLFEAERGRRVDAENKVKKLQALTKDKRDLLGMLEQLSHEVDRLESQSGDYWKHMYEDQLRRKRALHKHYGALRDLVVKLLVLLYDEDLHWLSKPTNDQIDRAEELALQLHAACYPHGEVARQREQPTTATQSSQEGSA